MSHPYNEHQQTRFYFSSRCQVEKAVHELEGILHGISADRVINERELRRLVEWLGEHRAMADRAPFDEVFQLVNSAIRDARLDDTELADLFWMCDRVSSQNEYFNALTADMQRLCGTLDGIIADRQINETEISYLRNWMDSREHLCGYWPFDEVASVIHHVLADSVITKDEHDGLMAFFREFVSEHDSRTIDFKEDFNLFMVSGICAVAPTLMFPDRTFCFTGKSKRAPRSQIAKLVEERGGYFADNVTQKTSYLVVGADGNPCWAFSCYGRKIETAVQLRKKGIPIVIVHEVDFWDHMN
jgi:hypothetical protein